MADRIQKSLGIGDRTDSLVFDGQEKVFFCKIILLDTFRSGVFRPPNPPVWFVQLAHPSYSIPFDLSQAIARIRTHVSTNLRTRRFRDANLSHTDPINASIIFLHSNGRQRQSRRLRAGSAAPPISRVSRPRGLKIGRSTPTRPQVRLLGVMLSYVSPLGKCEQT